MNNKFHIENYWEKYDLCITNEYGFKKLSITEFIMKIKDNLLEKGYKKILDLGCGSGRHSIYFNKNGFKVYASDIDCKNLKENIRHLNINDINICEHSFTNILYDNEFFDAIICSSTIHHAEIKDIKKGISEIYRVLKPNGYFVFDMLSIDDESFGLGTCIEENTFVGSRDGEENIPHHYANEKELQLLLDAFSRAEIKKSIYCFKHNGKMYESKVFDVIAVK